MVRWLASALTFGSIVMWSAEATAGGKLGQVRSEVRGRSTSTPTRSASSASSSSRGVVYSHRRVTYTYPAYHGGSAACCVGNASPGRATAPRSPLPAPTVPSFDEYPYAPGNAGYVRRLPKHGNDERDHFAGTAQVEGAYAGDGVWKAGGGLSLRAWRFGLDSDLHYYLEQRLTDALYLGSANATFAIVMRPPFVWRLGPGVNYMIDGRTPGEGTRDYAAGVNFTTTMDIVPHKPVVLSMRFDYGRLWKAPTMTVRGTVGWIIQRWELYAGYEYKRVGDVPLGGPVLGVRLWF